MTQTMEAPEQHREPLPAEIVVDEHISLSRFVPDDAQATFDLLKANEEYLHRTQPGMVPETVDQLRGGLEHMYQGALEGKGASYKIINDGRFVGGVNLFGRQDKTLILGYWLEEASQGKGIVTKSLNALLEHGFNDYDMDTVRLEIGKSNTRSQATARRMGAVLVDDATAEDPNDEVWEIHKA